MSLSADRNTQMLGAGGVPVKTSYPVAASPLIYKGSLVCLNSSGLAVAGSLATTLTCVGVALTHADNSSGTSSAINVECEQGVFAWDQHGTTLSIANVGALMYVYDDHTVTSTSTSASIAGTLYMVDANGEAWVYSGLAAPVDASSISSINTTIGTIKASVPPICTYVKLTTASSLGVLARFTPGFAGSIVTMTADVAQASTSTSKAAVVIAKIAGVATSGGAISLSSTNTATQGAKVNGTTITASNAFTASQEITLEVSSATVFTDGEARIYTFFNLA